MTYAVEVNMTRFDLRSCKMYHFFMFSKARIYDSRPRFGFDFGDSLLAK